jgi:hypothetical protein
MIEVTLSGISKFGPHPLAAHGCRSGLVPCQKVSVPWSLAQHGLHRENNKER